MHTAALLMVLGAAVLHAAWNLAAKAQSGDSYVFVWWYSLASTVLLAPIGVVLLMRDVLAGRDVPWGGLLLGALVSGLLHIGYNLCLQTGYARAPLGIVYPTARGVGPTLTLLVAVAFLGERPGARGLAGALLVILGVVVVALPGRRAGASGTGTTTPGPADGGWRAGLRWGAATGAFIAGYTLWDDHSVAAWNVSPLPYYTLICAVETLAMSARLTPARRAAIGPVARRSWKPILAVATLSPGAYVLVLAVMRTQPVALIAPLRESSIVIGALAGWLLFREPHPGRRIAGAVLVLAGIALTAA